jgi:transmembrane protein 70
MNRFLSQAAHRLANNKAPSNLFLIHRCNFNDSARLRISILGRKSHRLETVCNQEFRSICTSNVFRASEPSKHGEKEQDYMSMSPLFQKYKEEETKHNGKLVYVGQLTKQLKSAKILSLTSSLFGICLMPFLTETLSDSGLFAKLFVFGTSGFFIFVTPLFSQLLTRRYVSRMYYNYEEKKFKAILFNFFLFEYKLEFSLDDIFVPDIPGVFSTVQLKSQNRSLFVDLNQISDLDLTQKIYGYDKPLDFSKYTEKKK